MTNKEFQKLTDDEREVYAKKLGEQMYYQMLKKVDKEREMRGEQKWLIKK